MAPILSDLNVDGLTGGPGDFPTPTVSPSPIPTTTSELWDLNIGGLTAGDGQLPGQGAGILPHDLNPDAQQLASSNATLSTPTSGTMLRRKFGLGAALLGITLSVLSA